MRPGKFFLSRRMVQPLRRKRDVPAMLNGLDYGVKARLRSVVEASANSISRRKQQPVFTKGEWISGRSVAFPTFFDASVRFSLGRNPPAL